MPHIHYDVEWLRPREVFERVGERNLAEAREAELELGWTPGRVTKTDLLEREDKELAVRGNCLVVPLRRFEIATQIISE